MNGVIRIIGAPNVTIDAPTGSERWTGGTPHDIVWTMTHPQVPVTSLTAWVNYSTPGPSGPWTSIAGPIVGSANPHSVTWALPALDASVYVNVTVLDPAGNRGWAVAPPFIADSTPPSVSWVPPNGSSGVSTSTNVILTFDGAMNRSATGSPTTVALQEAFTGAWIPVTYLWSGGDSVLTMDPNSTLTPMTDYRAWLNASAKDASDPGNALPGTTVSFFTTGTSADLVKPEISNVAAVPASAEYPAPVNVTATITDNDQVAGAYVNLTVPGGGRLNGSMAVVAGSTWAWEQTYALLGPYTFRVEAMDASGNWNRSLPQAFSVRDTTRPLISNLLASPSPAEVYERVNLTASVSDPFLDTVTVAVNGTNASMSPGPVAGTWYFVFTPTVVQAYPFVVWAEDTTRNFNSASGTVTAQDTKPPPMPTGLVANLVSGGVVELSWSEVSALDLDGYKLYRSTSASGPFTTQVGPGTIRGATYIDVSVVPGVAYHYVLTSVDTRGLESMHGNIASVTVPAAPADLTPWIAIAGGAVAIVVAAVAILLWRRRVKGA